MDQIICGGCRTLLMYTRGARSVRCLCCQMVNLTINQVATIHCGCCRMALMYPAGAPSVKCAICHFITNVGTASHMPYGASNFSADPTSSSTPRCETETVVIENPTSFDQSGKPINSIVVGVTPKQK